MSHDAKSTLLQVVPFALALAMITIAIRKGRIRTADIGLHAPTAGGSWRWVLGFLIYSLAVEGAMYWYYDGQLPVAPWRYAPAVVVLRVVGILALAPIVEELLLRGVLLALLRRKQVPVLAAIALQSLVFTLLHFGALSASWTGNLAVLQIFIDGVLFGLARYHTGSLYPAIAMHMLGNAIAVAERLLPG